MEKYDVRFFPNGRVYFLDYNILDEALEAGKEILIVMNCWSGGYALAIGANKIFWYDENTGSDKIGYEMYSYDIRETEFSQEDLARFYKVIFTNGVQIRMKTGDQAVCYISGEFIDWDTSYQDFKKKYIYNNETEEQFEKLRREVDWEATKSFMSTEKDFQDKIEALSHYSPFYELEVK